MKKTIAVLSLIVILTLSACHKDPGTVAVKFNATFGSAAYHQGTVYHGTDGHYYNFDLFAMFFSHITLIKTDNSTVEISPVFYFNGDDANTATIAAMQLPEGSYKAVKFGLGLDSLQSITNPGTITDQTSPLYIHSGDMYWPNINQYVYVMLQGHADNTANPSTIVRYHVGTYPYYRVVTIPKSFTISNGSQTTLNIATDLQKLFYGAGAPLNVDVDQNTQTSAGDAAELALAQKFMNQFALTFSIQ